MSLAVSYIACTWESLIPSLETDFWRGSCEYAQEGISWPENGSPLKEAWDDCSPGWQVNWSLMKDLEPENPVKLVPDSWPTYVFELLTLGVISYAELDN